MSVRLLTEHHLEFLSLKGGCTGSSESTLVKMPHCWKLHVTTQISMFMVKKFKIDHMSRTTKKLHKIYSYPSFLTFVLGAKKSHPIEMFLLSSHNICFGQEKRKNNF